MIFYNSCGNPVAYTDNGEDIYLFSGEAKAYIFGNAIYKYEGEHIGFIENGWIRELSGACILFSDNADSSGPIKPAKYPAYSRYAKNARPYKYSRYPKNEKVPRQFVWSDKSAEQFLG